MRIPIKYIAHEPTGVHVQVIKYAGRNDYAAASNEKDSHMDISSLVNKFAGDYGRICGNAVKRAINFGKKSMIGISALCILTAGCNCKGDNPSRLEPSTPEEIITNYERVEELMLDHLWNRHGEIMLNANGYQAIFSKEDGNIQSEAAFTNDSADAFITYLTNIYYGENIDKAKKDAEILMQMTELKIYAIHKGLIGMTKKELDEYIKSNANNQ